MAPYQSRRKIPPAGRDMPSACNGCKPQSDSHLHAYRRGAILCARPSKSPGWCSKCQGGIGYRYAMRKRIPPEILVDCGRNCWIFQSYLAILIVIRRDTTGSPCRSRSRWARGWNETTRDSTSHRRSNRRRVTHD